MELLLLYIIDSVHLIVGILVDAGFTKNTMPGS